MCEAEHRVVKKFKRGTFPADFSSRSSSVKPARRSHSTPVKFTVADASRVGVALR